MPPTKRLLAGEAEPQMKSRAACHQEIREALARLGKSRSQLEAAFGGKGLPLQEAARARVWQIPHLTTDQRFKLFYEQPEMSAPAAVHARAERSAAWQAVVSPPFLERLRAGSRSSTDVECAIAYFEIDPWHFHSGYIKQELARILRTFPLKTPQRFRIGEVLVGALQKGKREDLKEYARLARYVDTPRLRARLAALTSGIDTGTAWRAKYVLDRCEMDDYRKDERSAR